MFLKIDRENAIFSRTDLWVQIKFDDMHPASSEIEDVEVA